MDKWQSNQCDISDWGAVGQCTNSVWSTTTCGSSDNPVATTTTDTTHRTHPGDSTHSTYPGTRKISMAELISDIKYSSTVFPDTDLGVHWHETKYGSVLYDRGYQVGRVRTAFGGGYWVEPYWGKANCIQESLDTEEEAKAYLVALYRLLQ